MTVDCRGLDVCMILNLEVSEGEVGNLRILAEIVHTIAGGRIGPSGHPEALEAAADIVPGSGMSYSSVAPENLKCLTGVDMVGTID